MIPRNRSTMPSANNTDAGSRKTSRPPAPRVNSAGATAVQLVPSPCRWPCPPDGSGYQPGGGGGGVVMPPTITTAGYLGLHRCPQSDSNRHCADFKSMELLCQRAEVSRYSFQISPDFVRVGILSSCQEYRSSWRLITRGQESWESWNAGDSSPGQLWPHQYHWLSPVPAPMAPPPPSSSPCPYRTSGSRTS